MHSLFSSYKKRFTPPPHIDIYIATVSLSLNLYIHMFKVFVWMARQQKGIWPRRLPACIATIHVNGRRMYISYTQVKRNCAAHVTWGSGVSSSSPKRSGEIFNIVVVDQQGRRRRTQGCGVGTHTRLASSSILHPIYNFLLPSTEPYQKRSLAAVELQFSTAVLVFRHLLKFLGPVKWPYV